MNNYHKNARTTVFSRALIVKRVLKEGKSVREEAEALGVNRRTVYKELARKKEPKGVMRSASGRKRPWASRSKVMVRSL